MPGSAEPCAALPVVAVAFRRWHALGARARQQLLPHRVLDAHLRTPPCSLAASTRTSTNCLFGHETESPPAPPLREIFAAAGHSIFATHLNPGMSTLHPLLSSGGCRQLAEEPSSAATPPRASVLEHGHRPSGRPCKLWPCSRPSRADCTGHRQRRGGLKNPRGPQARRDSNPRPAHN